MRIIVLIFLSLTFLAFSKVLYSDIDETMVLCLSFDDGQGVIATDSSIYKLNGKIQGAKWVEGKFGKALEFNGETDLVQVADAKQLLLLDSGTLMAWVNIYTEKGHASWPRILIKSNTNGGTNGYDFLFDRANGYSIRFCIGGVCNSYFPVETKSWHHVAVSYDGKMIYIYLDGKKVGEGSQSGPAIDTTGSALNIGNGVAADRAYHGILDEIRIWSRALDENEIASQISKGTLDIIAVDPALFLTATWADIKRF